MSFPYILKSSGLTAVVDGKSYVVDRTHKAWEAIVEAVKTGDSAGFIELADPPKAIAQSFTLAGFPHIEVYENSITFNGAPLNGYLIDKILAFQRDRLPIDPMIAFLDRIMKNPSYRVVQQLYLFLEASDLPITPDGYFLAYKRVRADYKDIHSATILNRVGDKPRVERNQVDEDPDRLCSHGLHVCSRKYLDSFGGARLMLVKVDPADVVAVPRDYHNTKMRTAGYEVIAELEDNRAKDWDSPVYGEVKKEAAFKEGDEVRVVGPCPDGDTFDFHFGATYRVETDWDEDLIITDEDLNEYYLSDSDTSWLKVVEVVTPEKKAELFDKLAELFKNNT